MFVCGKQVNAAYRFMLFFFIFLSLFVTYYWKMNALQDKVVAKAGQEHHGNRSCKGQGYLTNATITPLRDKNSFIIAPYSDKRDGNFIRVLSIVHHEKVKELYCVFCCQNSNRTVIVKAEIDIHSDRFEFPYGTADLLCLEPQDCDPQFISVHPSADPEASQLPLFQIQNLRSENPTLEFTVCISTMFGEYNNVLQFVQSIELYKILGAQKVMIYKNSCSPLLEQVLEYYISEGTVEIIPWPIHLYLKVSSRWHHSMEGKDIGYYGQITALNDCIYHNMYRSKYVALIDADEVILPVKDADWKSLMQRLEKENPEDGVFLFENHVYGNSLFSTSPFKVSSWHTVPGENILEYVYRQPKYLPAVRNRKMMIDPRKVVQTSVHNVIKKYGNSVSVKNSIAVLFHCKKPESKDLDTESIVPNKILWRYSSTLIPNINKVLHKSNIL
ncbi:beta-1,4-galactosyltransferase galt-1-like [Candoia aspera]|uniref:beta-1,4-galactosyltransferase galt-1-like n=1 Tax=Candoia aspera TaxID=51853 RepID=UPI002FD85023